MSQSGVARPASAKPVAATRGEYRYHRAITTRFGRTLAMMCPSLEAANPALADGHPEPPVTDAPGLMLHVVVDENLVSHTVSLG